ncbi:protein CIP2A homolog [Watersipora subatra]|uniref:protein CIP2A homolog n=1 Tax=Watersipora subatra TaxID=2589382 RepID=UPI00355B8696
MSSTTERSEALSSLLHTCASASNAYVRGCEESIVNRLKDAIKSLGKHIREEPCSIRQFAEENRLSSECLMSLTSVLGECDSTLGATILTFLHLISTEPCTASLLYNLGLMDTLIYILDEQHTASHVQVMEVIARISLHIKFKGHEMFIDGLLQRLISNIISNDASLKPSLSTLVNLSADCLPVQMQLRSLDKSSLLRKSFIKLVSHDDNEVSIISIAAMISTGMSEDFNKLIGNDKNLDQILKLSFSIILSLSGSQVFGYVVDVMVHLLRNKRVQHFLVTSCPKLESFVSRSASLLTSCEEYRLVKLFELLLEMCTIPAIRLMLTTIVFAPVCTSSDGEEELLKHVFYLAKRSVSIDAGASILALKFIASIYEGLLAEPPEAGSTCHLNFQFLTECLKQNELDSKAETTKLASSKKILTALSLLEMLITSDVFCSGVLAEIESSTITDVIEYQLQNNPVAFNWNNKTLTAEQEKPSDCSKVGVEIVLSAMSVIIEATERNESYSTCLSDYLQKTSLLPFIATGLSSSGTDQISLSLKLITKSGSLGYLHTTILCDVLSGLNKKKTMHGGRPSNYQMQPKPAEYDNKENNILLSSPCLSPVSERIVLSSQGNQADVTERLASLQVGGDSHVSDIISVYEQKLRGQKTREAHLDDLVQAKTMALSQADRLIQQYKSRLAQVDSEMHKLRCIVHESERRSEGYRDKMNEMLVDRERMQTELERLLQDSRKLEETQKTLSLVRRELETLTYFNENLKHQHQDLEAEYSSIKEADRKKAVAISEKDTKIAEQKKAIKKSEDQFKKLTTEKNAQEEAFKAEIKKLEKTIGHQEDKLKVIFEAVKK